MKRNPLLFLAIFALAAACGGLPEETPSAPEEEVEAEDIAIGEEIADSEALPPEDLCSDEDECNDTAIEEPDVEALAEIPLELDETQHALTAAEPHAGSKMITSSYAPLRRAPNSNAARYNVAPHGGVDADGLHPSRNPRGYIPPGKTVTLVDPAVVNGYSRVRYDGVTGWLARSRMIWLDPRVSRLTLAKRANVRNAFFKHQIRRTKWNKDGPLTSGNCSPTSLAMAINVLGAEPNGLSIEESIHRVRRQYDPGLHERQGTARSEIESAARKLNLHVLGLRTDVSPSTGMQRLRNQLAAGRVVVLNGMPGKPNAGATRYERAFTRAYRAAIANGQNLRHSSYNFNGGHSIVVIGREASGRYIVGDPISEVGFLAITAAEMQDYITRFARNRGTGIAVWR